MNANNAGPIGFGRGVIRYLGRIVSTIPLFLGYFWMLWDRESQCWQDKFANDYVVPVDADPITSAAAARLAAPWYALRGHEPLPAPPRPGPLRPVAPRRRGARRGCSSGPTTTPTARAPAGSWPCWSPTARRATSRPCASRSPPTSSFSWPTGRSNAANGSPHAETLELVTASAALVAAERALATRSAERSAWRRPSRLMSDRGARRPRERPRRPALGPPHNLGVVLRHVAERVPAPARRSPRAPA